MNIPVNSVSHPPGKAKEARHDHPLSSRKERREIDVNVLFEGAREVALLHRGEAYSLRITTNGKLILTK